MVINKKDSKIRKFVKVHFVGTLFLVSIISWNITTESKIILPAYSLFSQLLVAEFQKQPFLDTCCSFRFLQSHKDLSLFLFRFKFHFLLLNLHSC